MEVKKISTQQQKLLDSSYRPDDFSMFVGQEHIKKVLQTAVTSSQKRKSHIGHMLFSGPSGFGKTTMAHIVSKKLGSSIKAVTGYAIAKPAEIISILNTLQPGDVLFIDEIHRLKPAIEEVLYIAMEDFVIDMVMPEGGNVRIPIQPFALVGATTKPENLSQPIKNRFVYTFHFMEYTYQEKQHIVARYLQQYGVKFDDTILPHVADKVDAVPREIHNLCVQIRDFVVTTQQEIKLTPDVRLQFVHHTQIDDGGLTVLHKKYLEVLQQYGRPMGVRPIALQLGVSEKTVEDDIEPLLLKLGKIEKGVRGRELL